MNTEKKRMKALFLIFHGFNEANGISKKIRYQVKALKECGVDVRLCHYDVTPYGERRWMVNDEVPSVIVFVVFEKIGRIAALEFVGRRRGVFGFGQVGVVLHVLLPLVVGRDLLVVVVAQAVGQLSQT